MRVSRPPPAELTYHVFYYLLAGASAAQRKEWGLVDASKHVLSAPMETPGGQTARLPTPKHCVAQFSKLCAAMKAAGVRPESQVALFELLAGILHLCDVRFVPVPGGNADASQPDDKAPLERAAKLLCVPTLRLGVRVRVRAC